METMNEKTNRRSGIITAARILYIAAAITAVTRIYSLINMYLILYPKALFQLGISTVFVVLLVLFLALQFAYVFSNKKGKIKSAIPMLIFAVVFFGYSAIGQIRTLFLLKDAFFQTYDIMTHIVLPLVIQFFFIGVVLAYSIVLVFLSGRNGLEDKA